MVLSMDCGSVVKRRVLRTYHAAISALRGMSATVAGRIIMLSAVTGL
jgi:hypothetical protein